MRKLYKLPMTLALSALIVACSGSAGNPDTEQTPPPVTPPAPIANKTFSTLIDNSVFMSGGHDTYAKFADGDIRIIKVTNLNRSGDGSLDWAVRQSGARIVVFEIGGVIDLGGININIINPYLYIAAQTAPSPGITIIKGGIVVQGHDIIIRHLSVRPGDRGLSVGASWDCDGISTYAAYNVLIDHCSVSWATDETLSVSGPRHEGANKTSRSITLSNNIIAECLSNSTHSEGEHSKGSLIHDYCADIAIVGNLYASNLERNPLLKPNAKAYISNNLIYNPLRRAIHAAWSEDEYIDYPGTIRRAKASIVGNVLIPGPDTPSNFWFVFGKMDVFHSDNVILAKATDSDGDRSSRIISTETGILPSSPMTAGVHIPISSTTVVRSVQNNVGARPAQRDAIDVRIISDIATKGGCVIDSQTEVEGYPSYPQSTRVLNVPTTNVEGWVEKFATDILVR